MTSSRLIAPHEPVSHPQRHDQLRAHLGRLRRPEVVVLARDVAGEHGPLGVQAAADQPLVPWLAPVLQAQAQERLPAHGRGAHPAVVIAHDGAHEVAEGAVELLDGRLEDRLDVGHAREPRAERVGQAELAGALAQALLALGGLEGHRRRGRGRGRRRRLLAMAREAAAVPVVRDLRERMGAAAPAHLLAVQERAVRAAPPARRRSRPAAQLADTGGGAGGVALDELGDRGRDAVDGARGDLERGLLVGGGDDQGELVAAVAGGDVVGTDAAAQRGADPAQHLVAR